MRLGERGCELGCDQACVALAGLSLTDPRVTRERAVASLRRACRSTPGLFCVLAELFERGTIEAGEEFDIGHDLGCPVCLVKMMRQR